MFQLILSITYYSIILLLLMGVLTFLASYEPARYYVKFVSYVIASVWVTTVTIPPMFLQIRSSKNALPSAHFITRIAKFLGITYRVRGKDNIVEDSGCIVLLNHQSSLDVCVLGELWKIMDNCAVIAKKEVLYFGTFGLATWLWGTIFINRQKSGEAQDTINNTANLIQKKRKRVLLFPEGHRHSGSVLEPFKKGAFHLAIASQTPIQPVVVSKYHFLNSKRKIFDSGVSYITILPAISTVGMTKEDLPKLIEKTYEIMNKTFIETSQETLKEHLEELQRD